MNTTNKKQKLINKIFSQIQFKKICTSIPFGLAVYKKLTLLSYKELKKLLSFNYNDKSYLNYRNFMNFIELN